MTSPASAAIAEFQETRLDDISRRFREAMAAHMRAHSSGTNVNPQTLLATDYLNQYNLVVMLLDALPTAPEEVADDLMRWQPVDYADHFQQSGFRDRSLAVAAYYKAPTEARAAFDTAIEALAHETEKTLRIVRARLDSGDTRSLARLCNGAARRLGGLVEEAAAIANGEPRPRGGGSKRPVWGALQARIDALFKSRKHRGTGNGNANGNTNANGESAAA